MKVLIEEIWWYAKEGSDLTYLPTEAVVNIKIDGDMDENEFFEAIEEELQAKHKIRPQGFHYEILEGTFH